jgi:hypothetical protein
MALSNRQVASAAGAGSVSLALTDASGNNRIVIGIVTQNRNPVDVTTMTYNGAAPSGSGPAIDNGTFRTRMFYWLDANLPASGGSYTLATDGSGIGRSVHGYSASGAEQATVTDPETSAATATSVTFSLTASAGADSIIGLVTTNTATAGASQTAILAPSAVNGSSQASSYDSGDTTVSYTMANGAHAAVAAAVQAAATSPTLTSPTGTAGNNGTTATGTVTTDTASGTLYIYTSTSATPPSAADLKAGTGAAYATSQAISSTGSKSFNSISGLSISTTYYNHYLHNANSSDSAIVTSSAFVMKNPGYTTPAIYLPNTDDVAASLSSLTLVIRTGFDAAGSPLYSVTNETTDAGGVLTFASTAISVGTAYKAVLWRDNGGEDESLAFTFTAIDLDV